MADELLYGKKRRLRCRFKHPMDIELMCASNEEAISLWRAIYPALRLWEDGYSVDTPDSALGEEFSAVT